MTRNDFLNAILDDGIMEITTEYTRLDQKHKREGAVAGFEACRGKNDRELLFLKERFGTSKPDYHEADINKHWYNRYYELQIEWVLNVLSAGMNEQGLEPLTDFTLRGYLKARDILGMKEPV